MQSCRLLIGPKMGQNVKWVVWLKHTQGFFHECVDMSKQWNGRQNRREGAISKRNGVVLRSCNVSRTKRLIKNILCSIFLCCRDNRTVPLLLLNFTLFFKTSADRIIADSTSWFKGCKLSYGFFFVMMVRMLVNKLAKLYTFTNVLFHKGCIDTLICSCG